VRFKRFTLGEDRLEMGRVYMTDQGQEVGPFDAQEEFPEGAHKDVLGGVNAACFAWNIGQDGDGDPIAACWWDTGTCANEIAEHMGEIRAVEARTVAEGAA